MATTTWFAADESCFRGYVREDHVVVRMWSDERGAMLRRATCLPSSGRAESWLQRLLAGETGRRLRFDEGPKRIDWPRAAAGDVLAEEVASAVDRTQPWRDWADWLWRHGDARGTRIELGEALVAARGTAREAILEAEIAELERRHGWTRHHDELVQASAALQRAGEARPKLRLEHGQLIGFTGAPAFGRDFACLRSLGELRTCVHDRPSFEQLVEALTTAPIGGLVSLTIDLEHALIPERSGMLIDVIQRGLPRLRKLVIQSRNGAGLVVGEPLVQALQRLLTRQREPLHWGGLAELELALDVPASGWEPTTVDGLCAALGRSVLDRLRLSAQEWPVELTRWMRASGFADRLVECRLLERHVERRAGSPTVVAVGAPVLTSQDDRASLAVWADWLSNHGDPLGELALLLTSEQPDPQTRARIATLQAEITAKLAAGRPEALVLQWQGPLLHRVELLGDRCPWPIEVLERVLASPAAAALAQLRVTGLDAATIRQVIARLSLERRTPTRLELDGRVSLPSVLDSLPTLRELQIGEPDPSALRNRRHLELRELGVELHCIWGIRHIGRLFARLGPELLPGLTRLILKVEPGRTGPPIQFTRLQLPPDAQLRVIGGLRRCDYQALIRWQRSDLGRPIQFQTWVD